MKKSLLAIAAMTAFAGAAQAQSSVTVYGLLDVGIMGTTNNGNINNSTWAVPTNMSNASGTKNGSAVGFMAGGESQSRIGFKGSEDLGGGTKAIFLLEQGFNAGTGNSANTGLANNKQTAANGGTMGGDTSLQGQLFNRGAYAGLSNDNYGTLTAGRQQNLMLDNIGGYDPVNAQMFSPLAFSGSYGGGGYTDESRVNNAFKYAGKFYGVNVNALYGPGGVAGSSTAGTTTGFQLGYEQAKYGVQAIASHTTDATALAGASANTSLTAANVTNGYTLVNAYGAVAETIMNTTAYQLTGKYNPMSSLWLKAGYEREYITTPSNYQQVNGVTTTTSGYSIATINPQLANKSLNVFWVGANYDFTPTIKGSIGYYYVGQLSSGINSQTAVAAGTTQYQSAMVEYYMSKRTNLYAAVANVNTSYNMSPSVTAGSTQTGPITTSQTYGIGMRHTF